jgi:transketolase
VLTVDAVRQASSGHVGLALGCAELGVVLFSEILKHDPRDPSWPDRDRFVLSGGHGSMLLYSLLHLSGYDLPIDEIRRFRQLGSSTPGHPEYGLTAGVETTTGPLGQGLGNAVGMALAERMVAARLGADLVDHRTWVLASDGDLMEGVGSEAASLAGHLGLGRLTVLYDDNGITIDGPTSLTFSEDVGRRFEAYGWEVQRVDGHDMGAVREALLRAKETEDRPHLVICRTHIGFGSPAVDTAGAHGTIGESATDQTRENLGWGSPPFELPEEAHEVFRGLAERGAEERRAWEGRRDRAVEDARVAELWRGLVERALPDDIAGHFPDFRGGEPVATRNASNQILNAIAPRVPALVGGSGDLSGSTGTVLKSEGVIERAKYDGRNLHFGVREHGMAAMANGMALHGGLRPYVGTFLVFSDYMRPSVRLAALMRQPVVFVFTHDSIFVGEDGPTHQPVEHVAALRAIPGLAVHGRTCGCSRGRGSSGRPLTGATSWFRSRRELRSSSSWRPARRSSSPSRPRGGWATRADGSGPYRSRASSCSGSSRSRTGPRCFRRGCRVSPWRPGWSTVSRVSSVTGIASSGSTASGRLRRGSIWRSTSGSPPSA